MSARDTIHPENKIECFCLNDDRSIVYAGTVSGKIIGYSLNDLVYKFEIFAHAGLIAAMVFQSSRQLLACLSTDNTVSVWRTHLGTELALLCRIPLWNLQPRNDERSIEDFQSESQALAFHDHLPRLATRSANGALLEIDFDDFGHYRFVNCLRLFRSSDLTCVCYAPDTSVVLAGSIEGQFGVVCNGEIVGELDTGGSNIHWIEPVGGGEFLLASDSRQVTRVSLYNLEQAVVGPRFCRDDLEHVALSNDGLSAYAGSFDRRVYRVDPQTCQPCGIVFDAPFKCRWVRPLAGQGEQILVQTRDGGLHVVDARLRLALKSVRHTPPAVWTADQGDYDDRIFLGGEPTALFTLYVPSGRVSVSPFHYSGDDGTGYVKRLVSLSGNRGCLLGKTNGYLLWSSDCGASRALNLGAPVRDLCEGSDQVVFVALEDGRVVSVELNQFSILNEFVSPADEPIWSLAFNGVQHLAVGERGGKLRILSAQSLKQLSEHTKLVRPKRMKWIDGKRLLFVWSDQLRALTTTTGIEELVIDSIGNTIEDFITNIEYDYVVFISYTHNIYLGRLGTGSILCMVPDGVDYSKGLSWLRPTHSVHKDGPLEFITYGRHGTVNRYQILNEKLLPAGRLSLPAIEGQVRGSQDLWNVHAAVA